MDEILVLVLALALDLALGDPPTIVHPVGWMGKLVSLLVKAAPNGGSTPQFLYGIIMVLAGVAAAVVPVYFLFSYLDGVAWIVVGALLLKATVSVNGLRRSAVRVKNELAAGNLEAARARMPALVSRETGSMDEPLVIAATVESVAENTSDSFVAPLFYFVLLGVPGAVAYRMVNTFDSMVGYHGRYEHLGKFAARLDDVLNFVPARITGLMMVIAAFIARQDASGAWRIMLRDHRKTESPNAGWPMSAAAGALGVQLEKLGHYRLGDGGAVLSGRTIDSMLIMMYLVAFLWVVLCFGAEGVRIAITC